MSTQAAVSEVANAAAECLLPVAAFQYAFDGIHNFTGLNWWTSIVIATVIIRTLSIPISIKIQKDMSLAIIAPKLQDIKQEVLDEGISEYEGQERIQKLCKEHGLTSLFSSYKWFLIQGPVLVSFFLAIQNMVEKVPSFKTGGASWFLDLTTADPFCLLPCLAAFTLWVNIELNTQEGLEGNPTGGSMKNVQRALAALSVPFTAAFPKLHITTSFYISFKLFLALFCYWITSNLFSLVYGLTIKKPTVKKWFNIPIPPPPSPGSQLKPAFLFFEQWKKYADAQAALQQQVEEINSSVTNRSIHPSKKPTSEEHKYQRVSSSSSVLSYKVINLEKKVKRRKKKWRWATIVIATIILRTLVLPVDILDLKIMANLAVLRNKVQDEGMTEAQCHEGMKKVLKEYGITNKYTVYKWMVIPVLVYVSFFFAVYNMVQKVPSFETGGASWFLDLTTSDPFYILPCLTSYTFWINVEKKRRRVLSVLVVPLYSYFPKAFLFWIITNNVYSLVYGLTIRQPAVKEFLNIPTIVHPPPSPGSRSKDSKPDFSSLEQFKKYADAQTWQQEEVQETNPTATNQSTVPSPQATVYNEVAIAAADSWLPAAAWMDVFDGIHKLTGINWWATIVIATIILRTLVLPVDILDLKIMANLAVLRNKVQDEGMTEAQCHEGMKKVLKEYGITNKYTVYKWMVIPVLVYVSFFFAGSRCVFLTFPIVLRPFKTLCFFNYALILRQDYDITSSLRRGALHLRYEAIIPSCGATVFTYKICVNVKARCHELVA
nr:mitochondrial inner membrane protein OXA1-like [Tanacetum cinerariifolium]